MNGLPHLLSNGVVFSLAAFPAAQNSSLCFSSNRVSPSLSSSSFHLFSHGPRPENVLPSIPHGENPILCSLSRQGQGNHVRKTTPRNGPASSRHLKVKRMMKTQKEADIEEVISKLGSSKPSEDCIARLFEQQPLRLHNNAATFKCFPQEPNVFIDKAQRLDRANFLSYVNESLQVSPLTGDVDLKADFSTKLLAILSSFKEGQFNDVKPVGVIESEPVEEKLGKAAMQRPLFMTSGMQNRVVLEIERQSKVTHETSNNNITHGFSNKDELSNYSQLDLASEHILDSSWRSKETPQDNQFALEEPDFSSESSDDEDYNEVKIMQGIPETGNVSLQHANGLGKGRLQSDSLSPASSSEGWNYVSPRHLSRSTGSRSRPSKSSIPGLRSKYSKPDPEMERRSRLIKTAKPLHLLSNPGVETNTRVRRGDDDKDDATITAFPKLHEQTEKKPGESINFDWWDSDQEDDPGGGLLAGAKLSKQSKVEKTGVFMPNSDVETESCSISRLKGEAKGHGTSRRSENLEMKPEECRSFDLSVSDGEGNLRAEENSMFEWSDSDAEGSPREEENSVFEWSASDTEDEVNIKNGLSSAPSQCPISFELKGYSTWPIHEGMATSTLGPSLDEALTHYNREVCQNSGSKSYLDCTSFRVANQNLDHDRLQQLPASVKFLEAPPWKSQSYPEFPFEIQYSYSETPAAPILGFRDHFSPFGPETMERPWTGGAHIRPRRHLQAIESFDPAIERKKAFALTFNRKYHARKKAKSREQILGAPLREDEIIDFVQKCHEERRHVSLGRDGLTHNMLHLIHSHWKRRPICKIKCRGVPTLDMDNLCFQVEDKTGGQIVYRSGGVLYVFRGRNYRYWHRPVVPFMLYRPASPVYPKLVPQAPAGLTIEEAYQLRILGQKVKPLLKLRKNSVLLDLVGYVRDAFKVDDLVSLDYEGLKLSDYRKIGAKLRELVPCVLLSLRNHRIVLWKGRVSRPSSIQNPEFCVDNAKLTAEPSLEATDAEGTSISASETKLICHGIPLSEPAAVSAQPVDDSISPLFKKEITQLHHLHNLDSLCEYDLTDDSTLEQCSHTGVQSQNNARDMVVVTENDNFGASNASSKTCLKDFLEDELMDKVSAPLNVPPLLEDLPLKWDEQGEMCANALSDISYDDRPFPVFWTASCSYNEQQDHLDGGRRPNFPFSKLDALWEVALKNRTAVELEGVDLEADLILQISTVFCEVAPAGPEYTDKLVNRLRLMGVYEKRTEKRFVVPLHASGNLPKKKKRISKQASHSPTIVMPPKRLETDDLARVLHK